MNYSTWFHGAVSVLGPETEIGPGPDKKAPVIQHGDLLHVDFGVTALGMNTDTQHLSYVLRPGEAEKDIPKSYLDGLNAGNRLQDIVRRNMKPGLTGNEVLTNSLRDMRSSGSRLEGRIYCHPIGDWGHSAGAVIGMANLPTNVPVLGDLPILTGTYYSVELYAEHFVPERNSTMRFFLEEDVFWDETTQGWEWVYGRQEKLHLIRSSQDRDSVLRVQT